jgi:hypothetical protein
LFCPVPQPIDLHASCAAQPSVRFLGFEVLKAMAVKSFFFWDVTPYSLLEVNRHFGGICHMFLQNVGFLSTDYTALYPRI